MPGPFTVRPSVPAPLVIRPPKVVVWPRPPTANVEVLAKPLLIVPVVPLSAPMLIVPPPAMSAVNPWPLATHVASECQPLRL